MKFTGEIDFLLNQAENLAIERVASLPVYDPTYYSRLIFVTTPGIDYGLQVGGASGWEKVGTQGSLFVETFDFLYQMFPANDPTLRATYDSEGVALHLPIPKDGNLVVTSIQAESVLTAGSITMRPVINTVPAVSTALNAGLNVSDPLYKAESVVTPGGIAEFQLTAGDTVGVLIGGNGSTLPVLNNVKVRMYLFLQF